MSRLLENTRLFKGFFVADDASRFFAQILAETTWHSKLQATDGGTASLKRGMAYASDTGIDYAYANLILPGQGWTPVLREILYVLMARTGYAFNSVLLNHYRDGRDVINWHSDREAQLGDTPVIASVNLGASRTFHFQDKETGEADSILLEHGDALLMLEHCQQNFRHAILKEKDVTEPRISLTYRLVHV